MDGYPKLRVHLQEWLTSLAHFLARFLVNILFANMRTPRRDHILLQHICLIEFHQDFWDGRNEFGVFEANQTLNATQ
jgi:hypothetical protein